MYFGLFGTHTHVIKENKVKIYVVNESHINEREEEKGFEEFYVLIFFMYFVFIYTNKGGRNLISK